MNKPDIESLRMFLISHHEDNDENSHYMNFTKYMRYVDTIEQRLQLHKITIGVLLDTIEEAKEKNGN